MTTTDLLRMVEEGTKPVVEFGKGVDAYESYLEPGMRARVVGARWFDDDVVIFSFDVSAFEGHNTPLERANFHGRDGKLTTAREAGCYPKDHVETLYFGVEDPVMEDTKFDDVLTLVDEAPLRLFQEFIASGEPGSYTAWLERRVLAGAEAPVS